MTVQKLIDKLKELPPDAVVLVCSDYGLTREATTLDLENDKDGDWLTIAS